MTIVKHLVIAFMAGVFTLVLVGGALVALDTGRERNVVAISEMLAEAAAGRVDAITVRGTRYEYRLRGSGAVTKVAYGPKTTAAELAPFAGKAKIDVE